MKKEQEPLPWDMEEDGARQNRLMRSHNPRKTLPQAVQVDLLSQDLAAASNSKNAFYSFICLACLGHYSPCATTTSSVEEIVV